MDKVFGTHSGCDPATGQYLSDSVFFTSLTRSCRQRRERLPRDSKLRGRHPCGARDGRKIGSGRLWLPGTSGFIAHLRGLLGLWVHDERTRLRTA